MSRRATTPFVVRRGLEFGRLQYGEPVEASPSPSGRGLRIAMVVRTSTSLTYIS